jgi:hypothetical protein
MTFGREKHALCYDCYVCKSKSIYMVIVLYENLHICIFHINYFDDFDEGNHPTTVIKKQLYTQHQN